MALRTSFNPFGIYLNLSFSDFEQPGGRGRPQTNAILTLDMSGVENLCALEGEKRVRNEAFKVLRSHLALDPRAAIIPHPKFEGAWLLKDDTTCRNVHVTVTSVCVLDDVIFG